MKTQNDKENKDTEISPTIDAFYQLGKSKRQALPRSAHKKMALAPQRNIVEMLKSSSEGRVSKLVPVRYGRMLPSPFTFYRGFSLLQAADLAAGVRTDENVFACGDAHLMNFGFFATPERNVVFDMNDFDETHPAPWEWDLKRLIVSLHLCARSLSLHESTARNIVFQAVTEYQKQIHRLAYMSELDVWYEKITLDDLKERELSTSLARRLEKVSVKAFERTHEQLVPKITYKRGDTLKIKDNLPTIFHIHEQDSLLDYDDQWRDGDWRSFIEPMLSQYKETLDVNRNDLLKRFTLSDMAFKVVGVGSVGTRCMISLLQDDFQKPLFLQIKEARPSVLEAFTQPSAFFHQGERVVAGQRLMQSASDAFLGWTVGPAGRHFYVRQLRDMKVSASVETFDTKTLVAYGRLCAETLARAHAKASGKAILIAGYMGKGDNMAEALVRYSAAYADQVEADYQVFRKAIQKGHLPVETSTDTRLDFSV